MAKATGETFLFGEVPLDWGRRVHVDASTVHRVKYIGGFVNSRADEGCEHRELSNVDRLNMSSSEAPFTLGKMTPKPEGSKSSSNGTSNSDINQN